MASAKAFFDSIHQMEGSSIGVSSWILVDQEMVNNFASVTRDMQFIHVDQKRAAKESPFKGTIAHGFLVLSLASKFASDVIKAASLFGITIACTPKHSAVLAIAPKFLTSLILSKTKTKGSSPFS